MRKRNEDQLEFPEMELLLAEDDEVFMMNYLKKKRCNLTLQKMKL